MTTKETYNRGRYWTPTIALCAGLIFSSVFWLTKSGTPNSTKVAEVLNAPTYWAIFVLPIGQLIAAIFILNRKFPTARIFSYAFVLFYNLQMLLLLLQGQGDAMLAALEAFKIVVWGLAFFADHDRIAKSSPK